MCDEGLDTCQIVTLCLGYTEVSPEHCTVKSFMRGLFTKVSIHTVMSYHYRFIVLSLQYCPIITGLSYHYSNVLSLQVYPIIIAMFYHYSKCPIITGLSYHYSNVLSLQVYPIIAGLRILSLQ